MEQIKMEGYKGFDSDMSCKGMKYEVGKTYEHKGEVTACRSGFHLCQKAIDVLWHYPPFGDNGDFARYGHVKGEGMSSEREDKIAFEKLTVLGELSIEDYVDKCLNEMAAGYSDENHEKHHTTYGESHKGVINYTRKTGIVERASFGIAANSAVASIAMADGYDACAVTTAHDSIALTKAPDSIASATRGGSVALTSGSYSIAAASECCTGSRSTGNSSVAACTGSRGKAETTGSDSVAVMIGSDATSKIGGNGSVAVLLGNDSKGISEGNGIVLCVGRNNKARGKLGDYLIFAGKDGDKIAGVKVIYIDGVAYKPDTWYDAKSDVTV